MVHGEEGLALLMAVDEIGLSMLHGAAAYGDLGIAQVLLDAGGSALYMLTTACGQSCLRLAAFKSHLVVVMALIDFSAGRGDRRLPMLLDEIGTSCLCVAAEEGKVDIVNALANAGWNFCCLLTKTEPAVFMLLPRREMCRFSKHS